MNKSRFFAVLIALLVICTEIEAEHVSESVAQAIAAQFVKERGMGNLELAPSFKAPRRSSASQQARVAYYVFNAEPGKGFVVVSGDDRTEQVLGYSCHGNFDVANIPENMQAWLDQYVEEIAMLDDGVITIDKTVATGGYQLKAESNPNVVEPILSCQWDQGVPFNFLCPKYNGSYCVTGCVATAMAQIMYYNKWPSSTSKTIPGYTQSDNPNYSMQGTSYSALATTTFNWDAMKNYYSSSETSTTSTANVAVANLMRYCGQAVKMDYGVDRSGSTAFSEVFVDYFRFSRKARKLYRWDYSYSQWFGFLFSEIKAHRPVLYSGQKHNGGHAFVCDGYDGTGYFHFNWGWRGDGDGYFLLSSLNPNGGGIGSVAGIDGYKMYNRIIIGLEPNTISTSEKNSVTKCSNLYSDKTYYTRSSSSDPFLINLSASHYNESLVSRTYDLGWGVYKSDGFTLYQYYTDQVTNVTLNSEGTTTYTRSMNFGKNYADGTYYLRPISRESGNVSSSGSPIWLPCHYSGHNYIKAVISGNQLTLTTIIKGDGSTNGVTASIDSYGMIKKVNRPLEVKVIVTNNSLADYIPFYLWANNNLVGANSLSLNSGSSGYVNISYTPTSSGTNNLKLTADIGGGSVYCTGSVNVDAPSAANLSMNIIGGNNYSKTTDNYLYFKLKVTNNLASPYNDYIIANMYKRDKNTGELSYYDKKAVALNLAASANTTANFTFSKLEPGNYFVYFFYYTNNSLASGASSGSCRVMAKGDVNGDDVCNAADVTALYNWILNNDFSALVNGDQNNDGVINAGDVTTVYNIILGE